MSDRVRPRVFLVAVCLIVNVATWARGTWWTVVGVACGVVAVVMEVARPYFVRETGDDVEAGGRE